MFSAMDISAPKDRREVLREVQVRALGKAKTVLILPAEIISEESLKL